MAGASRVQPRTISHTGSELGSEAVELLSNQTSPVRKSAVAKFTVPDKYEALEYVGDRDPTRFVPRTMQQVTASDDDGSAALEEDEVTFTLDARIQAVAGETELDEQEYPVVEAVNVTQGVEIEHDALSVDYHANAVTVDMSAVAIDDVIKFFPILAEGYVQFQGTNQFGQVEGPVSKWETPIYRWHDFLQDRAGTEINLAGRIAWEHSEYLEVLLESKHALCWEDDDYSAAGMGAYVSTFQQDVQIELP